MEAAGITKKSMCHDFSVLLWLESSTHTHTHIAESTRKLIDTNLREQKLQLANLNSINPQSLSKHQTGIVQWQHS